MATLGLDVLKRYFAETEFALTRHHLDSYEQCMFEEIPSIVASSNPIVLLKGPLDNGDYTYRMEIYIGPTAERPNKFTIAPPVIVLDGGQTVRRMFPNEARLRNLTYAAQVNADILVRFTITEGQEQRTEEQVIPAFPLFRMPVLLRSSLCATGIPDPALLEEMGECRNDYGGYFIIGGAEKVLITRGEQAFNSLYVEKNKTEGDKIAAYASVVSLDPKTKQTRRVAIYIQRDGEIRVAIPMVRGTFPLFILFRAMGVESDEEIIRMIFPTPSSMDDMLIPSIVDAYPIYSKFTATEFIKTLTKGFSQAHVLDILNNLLLAHVLNEPLARAQYLAEMVREALLANAGLRVKTDRDDMRNQRFLPTGVLVRELFNACWKDWRAALALQLDTIYNTNDAVQGPNMMRMFERPTEVFQPSVLNTAIMRGFRGRWGTSEFNEKSGVLQPLARISYLDATSHTRRVVSDFDTGSKITGPRKLHTSQVGYFCTSETPTGAHIGATKNMSMMTQFSIGADTQPVYDWMRRRGWIIPVAETTAADRAAFSVVQINGGTIGFTTEPTVLVRVLRLMKWNSFISPTASISFNTTDKTVRILLDEGRPVRPLWHLPLPETTDMPWVSLVFGTSPQATKSLRSVRFFDPLGDRDATAADYEELAATAGFIEYCDPVEMNEAYVSWWLTATEDHTHAEIHPSTLTGLLASMIPYSNHNQAPRNQLSCSQSKQGIGTMVTNIGGRYETYAHQMCYAEAPICRTLMYETVGGGEMAYGFNCIIAATAESGYNQDDGLIINRDSVERGMFQSMSFRSYDCAEETDTLTKSHSHIASPWADGREDWAKVLRPGLNYGNHLDENGIVREGTVIDDTTVLVARYMEVPRSDGAMEVKDTSVTAGLHTEGRVDSVVVLFGNDGKKLVKVRVLQMRLPQLGDKFSSRHGQKGTIGMLVSSADLPRTAEGLVPDVMVNPGGLISRMTVAQLVEMVAGRLGAELAMKMSATTFGNDGSYVGMLGDMLQAAGCSRTGDNVLYSGITGAQIHTDIFMCPLYFMRLKHLTEDKVNARGAGRREMRTHQPTGGRANEGGLRIGEMERDSLCAHGVSTFLQESMMRRGDATEFWICNGCGTIPIYNEAERLFVCPMCDGPVTFTGDDAESLMLQKPTAQSRATFSKVAMPYALKLLDQEIAGLGNMGFHYITEGSVSRLREKWDWPAAGEIMPVEAAVPVTGTVVPPPAVTSAAAAAAAAPVVIDPTDATNLLSMYASTPFTFNNYEGEIWPTLEHYYRVMTFPEEPIGVINAPAAEVAAGVAALTGPTYYERKELIGEEKTAMLRQGLLAKFADNPAALAALKATGNKPLVAEYDGINLGQLLMEIRKGPIKKPVIPTPRKADRTGGTGGATYLMKGGDLPMPMPMPLQGSSLPPGGMYFIINPDMRAGVEAKARAPRQVGGRSLVYDEPQQEGGATEMVTETKFPTVVTVEKEE